MSSQQATQSDTTPLRGRLYNPVFDFPHENSSPSGYLMRVYPPQMSRASSHAKSTAESPPIPTDMGFTHPDPFSSFSAFKVNHHESEIVSTSIGKTPAFSLSLSFRTPPKTWPGTKTVVIDHKAIRSKESTMAV